MTVVTRFAPSPTGFLHIGGARTALYNWLYAKHTGGKFLLRIEDTDRERSTPEAVEAIFDGLSWLGLTADEEPTFQFARRDRHAEVAHELIKAGKAYYCYCSQQELQEMREKARAEGRPMKYDGTWRDRDASDAPAGVKPVVRLKAPQDGDAVISDQVQGDVRVANEQLDDYVILRGDGTPTYMLSVVVDDHDMGITHVIRGDDHLTNAFRQKALYDAMGWDVPTFAHIPLIHGPDGAKLSKRHGALGVDAYRDEMGFLPEAVNNYLLRLGWGHGDEEIISQEQAIEWFDIKDVGKGAARFDFAKLTNLNGVYLRQADDTRLANDIAPLIAKQIGVDAIDAAQKEILIKGMSGLKERAKTLIELADSSAFYVTDGVMSFNEKAQSLIDSAPEGLFAELAKELDALESWTEENVDASVRNIAEKLDQKLGKVAQPLRAVLTGSNSSPGIFEVMIVLGKSQTLKRIRKFDAQ
ncbi:glutamyl-tRNA synthetase [Thalassospira sp. MBR-102]|jgi:glutamyl-tRNA synthetase|uniref:Glutamate--tRNA ligase n=4 Tax=Thalassospira TaxID=168934 RepID=A0AB72UDA0_9PROT|nr:MULTISPECIES: glutamate--tRNA ligase [Thalassospira]AJD52201.1 glutamyl-tRNA ligase [Thalassospira xiamenensis M-5 = DSM 17429]KEO53618.1 glutamyl-tRNA synthetase [Thalassospira permensis NBRC 106175]MAB32162.1 glutamate--tRNA ligase [Thalassospira sp.]MBA05147.1 glutamate--tRNA ligase [Thalassospira sp.]MDM7975550.1 glutamate--tRNA ligase [Thalassospira xiamenensis]|tara:strand:- start:1032 stop:2441 length:1410 start_codon:yes stop_codon:yes gene_type:complete